MAQALFEIILPDYLVSHLNPSDCDNHLVENGLTV